MKILSVKELPDGSAEYEVDLTEEEKEKIMKDKGWDELTPERLTEWLTETIENTYEYIEKNTE